MIDKLMKRVEEGKIILKLESNLQEVLGDDRGVNGALLKNNDGSEQQIAVSGIFIAIGHKPNTDIFKGQLEMDEVGYLKTKGGTADNVGATNIEARMGGGRRKRPYLPSGDYQRGFRLSGGFGRGTLAGQPKHLNAV